LTEGISRIHLSSKYTCHLLSCNLNTPVILSTSERGSAKLARVALKDLIGVQQNCLLL